ncbi:MULTISPECIES: alpha-hydroxy acid oxidase [Nonomuraea]|uniref:Alpha-hydroxy acid oxidase n=2 Tax=Nonomuraea TaxID=83681 RepID=A0ABW1C4M8_9ACTN|nr:MULTISPECIES: alpha-hydroxy acid oxidase [Nonomuraea]TXK39719.1 alpha-hydroxy-acid oxidizing protein [Nonomuraea sp. C10]
MDPVNLREYEQAAKDRLDPDLYDYFAGGAQDEVTLRANEAAFRRLMLVPRVLTGAGEPALDVTILGRTASMPVLVAPTAFHRLAHPEGELATGRAVAAAGGIMITAMLSTVAMEEVAATGAELWFQFYLQPDPGYTEHLVRRAEAAGCRALVITVDSPALRTGERARSALLELPAGLSCPNLGGDGDIRQVTLSPEISWEHVDRLRRTTSLPIVLKGILHPADAALAVAHGADAIIVSNHGGRQLDSAAATIDRLPAVADAVGGRVPVLLDGGVRRGTDVVKALALGARAVAIGRPVVWGLSVAGADGVAHVLALLRAELANALTLCGLGSAGQVPRDLVVTDGPAAAP